jgi:hypothetical protein
MNLNLYDSVEGLTVVVVVVVVVGSSVGFSAVSVSAETVVTSSWSTSGHSSI